MVRREMLMLELCLVYVRLRKICGERKERIVVGVVVGVGVVVVVGVERGG